MRRQVSSSISLVEIQRKDRYCAKSFMEAKQLIENLVSFLQTDPACQKSLAVMKNSAEISIVVGGSHSVRVAKNASELVVESGEALHPDFVFEATPAAISTLIAEKGLTPGQLGVKLLKEIVAQDVTVRMPGSILQLPRKGYLELLKIGGQEFLQELRKYDLSDIGKIMSALKNLRR
ncbi:MAG: hypothetical protein KDD33_05720 [Bdellovibrionales bacterium]|nr:hypothetical protein [Bdellovibrionales bacterium]